MSLVDIIENVYEKIVITYNLKIVLKDKNNILFKSDKNFAFGYIFYDHLDVGLVYFDITPSNILGYDITEYFSRKRRQLLPEINYAKDKSMSQNNYWECIFRSNANVLLEGGKDILSGDKEWLKEITWTKGFPVSPEIIPYLRG